MEEIGQVNYAMLYGGLTVITQQHLSNGELPKSSEEMAAIVDVVLSEALNYPGIGPLVQENKDQLVLLSQLGMNAYLALQNAIQQIENSPTDLA